MRIAEIAFAAVIGGAIGFAASTYVAGDKPERPDATGLVDARIDARLSELGLADASALDGRISGGVAQFLADQPEAVMVALEQHQANQETLKQDALRKTVAGMGDALTNQPGDPAFGAAADVADVTLVEFFDYRCGYCKRSLDTVVALTEDDPKLRVVLKEFPILGPESLAASQVSLAANMVDPSLHKTFHIALMRHRGGFDAATLLAVAAKAGYDPAAVENAMQDETIRQQLRNGYEIAEALGIRGTPAFVIGDRVIPGAVSGAALREAIEAARGASKG